MQNNRMVYAALGVIILSLAVGVLVRYEVLKGRTQAGAEPVTDFSSCLTAQGDLDITGTICTSATGIAFTKPGTSVPIVTPTPTEAPATTTTHTTSAATPLLLNVQTTFFLHDAKKIADGPTVTLSAINDSRCKPGVQCIWAGEFSTDLTVVSGAETKTITLGNVRVKTLTSNAFTFTLTDANADQATITVTKAAASTTNPR